MQMLPLSTNEEGACLAFPDVCDTPAGDEVVPVPYANSAVLEQADMTTVSATVFIVGKNAVTENTEIVMSGGDEAGVAGGVVSGTTAGPCRFRLGSSVVSIEGYAAAFCGTRIAQNGDTTNAPHGIQVAPSQGKVFVVP
ncbi:MAG: DUF4150 domain-containing protein [Planctomycetia bacterium]|nr:DUF4150 domain-containing protein [Planctomycetia bacterium]